MFYGCSLTDVRLDSSYITRNVVFQTLKAITAKAKLKSSLARLIRAATSMIAVVGSASLLGLRLKLIS